MRRINILLTWLEKNPEVYEKVTHKMAQFLVGQIQARSALQKISSVFGNTAARVSKLGSTITATGFRLGWLGFRMAVMGRMLMRYMLGPLRQGIGFLTNWQSTMGNLAVAIGLATARGQASGTMLGTLNETLLKLPTTGLLVQEAMGLLTGVFATIATDVGPTFADIVVKVAEAFMDIWDVVGPMVIPILETLRDDILPPLLDTFREVGPVLIEAFVETMVTLLPHLNTFLKLMAPLAPIIGKLLGYAVGLAPVFVAIGTALYFLSPILNVIGTLMLHWPAIWGAVSSAAGVLYGLFVAFTGPMLLIIGFVVALIAHWDELSAEWKEHVGPAVKELFSALGDLSEALFGTSDAWEVLKIVTTPLKEILAALIRLFGDIIRVIARVTQKVANLVKGFGGFGGLMKKLFGGSIHKDIAYSLGQAERSFLKFQGITGKTRFPGIEGEAARGGGITGGPETYYTSVYIGNVSGVADMDMVYNTVNRAIGEKRRRRGR